MPKNQAPSRGRRFPAEILTTDEVRALVRACSNRAPTGIRNRALLVVLWRGGLRVSEALTLHLKDLDPTAGSVRVLRGKGNKARVVGLDPPAFAVVERWLDARKRRGLPARAPVFCTLAGEPIRGDNLASRWRDAVPRARP